MYQLPCSINLYRCTPILSARALLFVDIMKCCHNPIPTPWIARD